MSVREILSEEEIEALMEEQRGTAPLVRPTEEDMENAERYDLLSPENAVVGVLPIFQTVMDRFGHQLRLELLDLLIHDVDLTVDPVSIETYDGFIGPRKAPCELNVVRIQPFSGLGLLVFERGLTFALVDAFFGGCGKTYNDRTIRDLTATELRMNKRLGEIAFRGLALAWKPYLDVAVKSVATEINPRFLTAISTEESFVVGSIELRIGEGVGRLYLGLACSMFEPVRANLLSSAHRQTGKGSARNSEHLREGVNDTEVQARCKLGAVEMSVGELLEIEAGDFIAADVGLEAVLEIGGVALFRGKCGALKGSQALEIEEVIARKFI